jgi:hypothetical protein
MPIAEVNLEDVVTHLELTLHGFGASWGRVPPELETARDQLDQYVIMRLGGVDRACSKHVAMLGRLDDSGDSVLTLNYDLVADWALYELAPKENGGAPTHDSLLARSEELLDPLPDQLWDGARPSAPSQHRQRRCYLKLHGSLNYLYCANPPCPNHRAFFVNWLHLKREMKDHAGSPCNACGAGLRLVIIPPAMGKSLEMFPKMGFIWNLAYRKLREADHWVLIGMSLPPSDYYLTWLLREARMDRDAAPSVTVVNTDRRAGGRVKSVVGVEDVTYVPSLEELIEHLH